MPSTEHFRIMAYAQLTWCESLRDIEATLGANPTNGQQCCPVSLPKALQRMRGQGLWLSDRVVQFALAQND